MSVSKGRHIVLIPYSIVIFIIPTLIFILFFSSKNGMGDSPCYISYVSEVISLSVEEILVSKGTDRQKHLSFDKIWALLTPGLVHILAPSGRYLTGWSPLVDENIYAVLPLLIHIQTL